MARIRSIHPGFYTDEDVVSVSIPARLLLLGLGAESDDKGTFPWKPTTIKMRLFPADAIDIGPLLEELVNADLVRRYSFDGKGYGAIRNFRKHQRPKKPNDVYPLPEELHVFAGLRTASSELEGSQGGVSTELKGLKGGASSEPVRNSASFKGGAVPKKGELAKQMEDGGEDGGCSLSTQEGATTDEVDRETGEIIPFAEGSKR